MLLNFEDVSQDDDGFILFESRAICRYIEAKYPKQGISLIPTELKANARFEQAASIETADFEPSASGIGWEKAYKPYDHSVCEDAARYSPILWVLSHVGLKTDEARTLEHIEKLNGKLDAYEAILSKQKYLAGDVSALAFQQTQLIGLECTRTSPWPISSISRSVL
jgi:glutathione S-transferase